ncbi:hypothetical protein [Olleya sp. UBA1516]|mgnify:CR=1 FL=1|uniref:hypothetical protein n=1 Tax=Olleya sp. UBA1516 TaxID=1947013 RepID=UPI0025E021BE|nr:hypothetical protein [Olleya sp. UBA1516]|tara:strand:+ start:1987 stop:2664 length:678 start_codon:yes stop_codon:yes gene_type:complete
MLNRFLFITILFLFFSCGNEKVIQLPEIQNAEITQILDVSPAYIFYDETKQDSVELNRKNLIISTNWLINVDKRLTLEQALPSIIKLQEKKRNATMHKNEKARNYYTCNDTSIKNLGFIDFTDVVYLHENEEGISNSAINEDNKIIDIMCFSLDKIKISIDNKTILSDYSQLKKLIQPEINQEGSYIVLGFKKTLLFQDYISLKSIIKTFETENTEISNNEFIFD